MSGRNPQPRVTNKTRRRNKNTLWEQTFKLDPMNLWTKPRGSEAAKGQQEVSTRPNEWERLKYYAKPR